MVSYIVTGLIHIGIWALTSPITAFKVVAITYIVLL